VDEGNETIELGSKYTYNIHKYRIITQS